MATYRGRFAPSPTGDLHLGSAMTALCAWLAARKAGGVLVLRMEDIDAPRVVAGSAERIVQDLQWLGLDWDEGPDAGGARGPYVQSLRLERYQEAIERLGAQGWTYPCDCSRAEIARIASAPHPGDEGPVYPGTCRTRAPGGRTFRRPPSVRLAVPAGLVQFEDAVQGAISVDVAHETGDFVLRRGDGVYSYQLAVVVDDLEMGITEVVRGADLLSSTGRQIVMARMLGGGAPGWAHVPLVVHADGTRLAKRARGVAVRHHRDDGRDPREIVAALARGLGLADAGETRLSARDLVDRFSWDRIARGPVVIEL